MQPLQAVLGGTLAAVVALLCRRLRLLDDGGAVAAAAVGGVIFACGGWLAGAALLTFFATSNLLGRWRRSRKEAMGYEKGGRRDAAQVLANGGVAAALLLGATLLPREAALLRAGFLAALAEANADTWATEIGAVAGGAPRFITTWRPARAGSSGAVSLAGTLAALVGSLLVASFAPIMIGPSLGALPLIVVVGSSGFAGSLFDSLLGATVQAQYASEAGELTEKDDVRAAPVRGVAGIDNDTVNLLSTLAAALAAMALYRLS